MATIYTMRAFKTSAPTKYVYWTSVGSADMTGQYSGYDPAELSGIEVDYTVTPDFAPVASVVLGDAAGGDLSGTYPNPTVSKVNGATAPAAGALTTGHVLKVSGPSVLTYGYITDVNVGSSDPIAGSKITPNFGSQNAAAASITLTDNVAIGSAPAQSGSIRMTSGGDGGAGWNVKVRNGDNTQDIFTAYNYIIGGTSFLGLGHDVDYPIATAKSHDVVWIGANEGIGMFINTPTADGDSIGIRLDYWPSTSERALMVDGGVEAVNIAVLGKEDHLANPAHGFGGGRGVLFLGDAKTVPTTNPTYGVILYSDAGALKFRKTDGTVVTVGQATTPGGTDTQIQFNDGGSFGGDSGFTYDKTNNLLRADRGGFGENVPTTGILRLGAATGSYQTVIQVAQNAGEWKFLEIHNAGAQYINIGSEQNAGYYTTWRGYYNTVVSAAAGRNFIYADGATFGVGTSANGVMLGVSEPDLGGGTGVIGIDNCTVVPTTNPTDGVILYSESGDLKYRKPDGTIITIGSGGGGGTPGGTDTQVQFNDGGAFGGDAGFTYNKTTNVLSLSDAIAFGTSPVSSGILRFGAGTYDIMRVQNSGGTAGTINSVDTTTSTMLFGDVAWNNTIRGYSVTMNAQTDAVRMQVAGSEKVVLGSGALALADSFPIAFGTSAATTGLMRFKYNGGVSTSIMSAKGSAATDVNLLTYGPGDAWTWGNTGQDLTINGYTLTLNAQAVSTYIRQAGTTRLTVDTSGIIVNGNARVGTTPATSGTINIPATGTIKFRNVLNSADLSLITVGSDSITIGDSSTVTTANLYASNAYMWGSSQSGIYNTSGSGFALAVSSTAITLTRPVWNNYNSKVSTFDTTANVQTTDATETTLVSSTLDDEAITRVDVAVVAVSSDASLGATYGLTAVFKRDAGVVTQIGSTQINSTLESDTAWNATIDFSGTSVRVRVTGKAGVTIQWGCRFSLTRIVP